MTLEPLPSPWTACRQCRPRPRSRLPAGDPASSRIWAGTAPRSCTTIPPARPPSHACAPAIRRVAERFELYVRGIELANGYHELLDPAALRERNRTNNELRAADGKYTLPDESRLLAAMDHGLPACSGCALGFDRLVMVATGAKSIQEVLAFPIERA